MLHRARMGNGAAGGKMKQTRFVLSGETPSKKNSRINTRSGRSFPSRQYQKWHDMQTGFILSEIAEGRIERFTEKNLVINFQFVHGDKRRRDSDNQCSSILDLLVDCGIIADDNWQTVSEKHIFDSYEKNMARVIITISYRGVKK